MNLLKTYTVKGILWLLPTFFAWTCLPASGQIGSGTTDGSFGDLNSDNPIIVPDIDGVGTNQLNWSIQGFDPNFFKFEGTSFENVPLGETFVLGTFSYKNGVGFLTSQVPLGSSVTYTSELTISSSSSVTTPFNFNQSFTERITLVVTPNGVFVNGVPIGLATPEQAADIFYFTDRPELGSFRIFENGTGTVEILGAFNSLDLVGFGNAISGGFTNPTIDPIPDPNSTVPEPTSILGLLAFGVLGTGSTLKRNQNKQKSK